MVSGSIALFCSKFFSPFPHGTGSLSVSQEYLALADGPAEFTQDFSCPALLRILVIHIIGTRTGLSPYIAALSKAFRLNYIKLYKSYNPIIAKTIMVWAVPRSIATTWGITVVLFSSGYLDVSVPRVCFLSDLLPSARGVAPFGYLRINSYLPIPAAFRSLSRPSSPLRA